MYIVFFICSNLYQIARLGDDDDEPRFSSASPLEEGTTFFFSPRPLKNLVMVDELDSLSPVMTCQVSFSPVCCTCGGLDDDNAETFFFYFL